MDLQRKKKKMGVGGTVVTCTSKIRTHIHTRGKRIKNNNVAHGSADLHFFFPLC